VHTVLRILYWPC